MVSPWRERFARAVSTDVSLLGLPTDYANDAPQRVVETTCAAIPPGRTHWSVRNVAEATGVGRNTVSASTEVRIFRWAERADTIALSDFEGPTVDG
jgi:hypothetical protein